jgi:UDP-glucose 4-epimerase
LRARLLLGFTPTQSSLDAIVRSAWDWMQAHPDGYGR